MPEFPDVELYCNALERFIGDQRIEGISIRSPFLVRSFEPDIHESIGSRVVGIRRLGKRIVWKLESDTFFIFHLMIAGRFHWKKAGSKPTRKVDLASFDFSNGTLMLTEAGSKKRASPHVVVGQDAVAEHDPGGLELFEASLEEFHQRLRLENHTLKRSLSDPRFFSGIGNAYSDKILHAAGLSPIALSQKLTDEQIATLFDATLSTLAIWRDRLIEQTGDDFPEKVTAFRDGMAVHGRFGEPCPTCQTDGRVLADRSLSRLLKDDWPRRVEDLE
ncbi:MAG: formamidopyrimidine-DNA glycosylase [Planctomycetaceae bacterium]|nr:formamidopyrimidine-DNA glycosylase [Planctomycetaceae bacterium]